MVKVTLLELLKMDKVPDHFFCRKVVEQADHALEQETVLATTELLGHDNARVGATPCLPLLVKRGEIANVEGKDGSVFTRGEGQLVLISGSIFTSFFGGQDVVAAAAQIDGQLGNDMAVKVQPNE
jgi:hypothetical protein